MVSLYEFILNSTPDEASAVRNQVRTHLDNMVGPVGNHRNLGHDAAVKTAKVVKKLLRAIENRLKQSPEIDLYEAHKFFCQTYLKHLCSLMTPRSYDYLNSRCDLIGCYEYLKKHEDIQKEGPEVLNDISRLSVGKRIPQGQVLPTYRRGCPYKIAETVIKICMVLLTACWNSIKEHDFMFDELEETENKDIHEYIFSLANEMDPWIEHFRSLPFHDRIRQWLSAFFKHRTLSLVKKRLHSEVYLIREYCTMTLSNFVKASMDDEICNFGEEICHSILSKSDDTFFSDSSIVICVLEFIAERCMIHPERNVTVEFFCKLAVHCTANRGPVTGNDLASFFRTLADRFSDMAPQPEVDTIQVHMFLNHLANSLDINELDSSKCGDPGYSMPLSNSQVSYDLADHLEGVTKACEGDGRINEAIELAKLCCILQWGRVLGFCKMLNSTKDGVSSGFSKYAICDLVTKASQGSASLLSLFNKHRKEALNTTLIELVERWLDANSIFDIPSPVALVHQWVDIQYQQTRGSAMTIYSLVQSLRTTNQSAGIILEQELNEYQKNKHLNQQLCKEMEMLIENTISEANCRMYGLSISDSLIERAARLASCGTISCQSDSITYLDQAISILVNLENTNENATGEQVLTLLIKAYCYKALFKRIVHPSSKEFTDDIENALKAWDRQSASHDKIKLCDNDIDLFFNVANLLALEGYRELNSKLYKMMIKRVKLAENRELCEFWERAWKSGSLNHALCASPVDELITKEMEDSNVQFWINCGKTQEQKAGIKQCLSVIPTLSSDDLRDDAQAQEAQKTINEVKEAVSTLMNEESRSFDSFGAARLHYDLAETFVAKGLFIQALSHATKSYLLRDKHLSECFDINWHEGQEMIVGQEDTEITKYDCTRFIMKPSSVSPFARSSSQTFPTAWSTVRCYLESSLQTGIVQEMIGNGDEAEKCFLRGQKIAALLHLPMFIARFSRALGKIYLKKRLWILALKNLKDAQEHDCSSISCLKCSLVSEAALNLQLGDFYRKRSQSTVKESDDMKSAGDFYIKAKTTLNEDVWNNSMCLPEPKIMDNDDMKFQELPKSEMSKDPQFCSAFGISGACVNVKDCWHCGPSVSEKSLFLNASLHMKWECIRRRHMVRLLTRLVSCTWPGKYCMLQGKHAQEYSYLLESVCVLVCRSTFCKQSVSTTFVEQLVRKGVMGDAYGVEHALVLYKMCCISIIHKDSSEVDKLSLESVMLGLKLAFVLSREFRKLHEKVSRLLAVMCAISEDNSTPERVSRSPYATYFHQTSIGSYFNSSFLSQDRNLDMVDDLRQVLAPCTLTMLETSVSKFFDMLPEVSILCISMLNGDSEKLLKHLLPQSETSVWIMVSKMSLNRQPILVILPIREVFEDNVKANPSLVGNWSCPWAHNMFDKLAPRLRRILEEDNKLVHSKMESKNMRRERRNLDKDLRDLLRDMESKWFGSWIHLLRGEWSDKEDLDATAEEIKNRLTNDALVDKNEELCKKPVILVIGNDIQMFPIENLPLLIKNEIYRMPSVGGIIWSISKHKRSTEDQTVVNPWDQTVIDPRCCYYLIYTDIEDTKTCFEKWSKTYEFKGHCIDWSMSRDTPETLGVDTLSELKEELKRRDLFVYMGHGDGRKFIQGEEIQKMDSCGAVILIGCSSGYISYSESSLPDGAPLDFLLGNSPAIVANLWRVSTTCMNLFTTELLQTLIDTKLAEVVACDQAAHEKADNENPNKRKAEDDDNCSTGLCIHKRNLGASFLKARETAARIRSYKDIAATVVYGVPVYIPGNSRT